MKYDAQDIDQLKAWFSAHKVTEAECLVPDLTGKPRGKIVPADRYLSEGSARLPEVIFVQTVDGDWPENDADLVSPTERDMLLRPDVNTVRIVPWVKDPSAQIIHDCFTADGLEHPLAPRSVLKRVLKLYDAMGLKPVVAPELEFFLVQKNTDPDFPLQPPIGRSGRPETARQSYSVDAVNEFDPIFEDMYDYCDAMNLDIDTLIHEAGAAQMEVNFLHDDPLSRADQVFLFKRVMREAALRHDVYATFMAKPMVAEPGSAMHVHQSLLDAKTGKNVFVGERPGELSDTFRHYLAGLQTYVPAAMAIFAPNVNSYRRIARDESAPINVHWGFDNRTAGLRVPHSEPQATRVESRFAGSDANPYLMLAATLAAGYLGMRDKLKPTEPITTSAYDLPYDLPRSLESALSLLEQCTPLHELMGPQFVKAFIAVKKAEYEIFFRVISSWEREFLLLNV
jgi:glutamine synthetase